MKPVHRSQGLVVAEAAALKSAALAAVEAADIGAVMEETGEAEVGIGLMNININASGRKHFF
jgi:hypothetical protein